MRARTSYAYYLLSSMHNLATTRSIYYTRASIIYYTRIIRAYIILRARMLLLFHTLHTRVTVTGHAYTSRTRVLLVWIIIILYLFINTRGDSILLFYTL